MSNRVLMTVEQAEQIEQKMVSGAAIRIMRSPYSGNAILIHSDATGEISDETLAGALAKFMAAILEQSPEVEQEID